MYAYVAAYTDGTLPFLLRRLASELSNAIFVPCLNALRYEMGRKYFAAHFFYQAWFLISSVISLSILSLFYWLSDCLPFCGS